MNADNKLENPTLQIKQFNMETKMLQKQVQIMETYLTEFCEVNGIKENEIKNHLVVATCPPESSIMAVNVDDNRDVKFGLKITIDKVTNPFEVTFKVTLEVFGEYTDCKSEYPKTTKLLELMKTTNGGNS